MLFQEDWDILDIAYRALYNEKVICSGYTDAMFQFIEKLGLYLECRGN